MGMMVFICVICSLLIVGRDLSGSYTRIALIFHHQPRFFRVPEQARNTERSLTPNLQYSIYCGSTLGSFTDHIWSSKNLRRTCTQ